MTSGILTRSRSIWTNDHNFSVFQKFLLPGKGPCPLPGITILFSSPAKRRGSRPFRICGTIHTLRLVFSRRLCPLFGGFSYPLGEKASWGMPKREAGSYLKGEKASCGMISRKAKSYRKGGKASWGMTSRKAKSYLKGGKASWGMTSRKAKSYPKREKAS